MRRVSSADWELLKDVIKRRRPDLESALDSLARNELTDESRLELRLALTEEFSASGLREDSEPNARGLQIESLIDPPLPPTHIHKPPPTLPVPPNIPPLFVPNWPAIQEYMEC